MPAPRRGTLVPVSEADFINSGGEVTGPGSAAGGAGGGEAGEGACRVAEDVGRELARRGAVVLTGGLGGVMEAASRGAKAAGGMTIGLLPSEDRADANPWVDVAVPTGMGEGRNVLLVRASQAVIAVGGGWGTLSEIALALRARKTVVGLDSWTPAAIGAPGPGVVVAGSAQAAVGMALDSLLSR